MDGCSHLGIAEREDIMVRWKCHEGVGQIARELHRDRPAISREIRRNGWQGPAGRRCRASAAQRKADRRRLRCRRPRLMDEPERRSLAVRPMRDERWSPEEISGRISEERPDLAVSDSAICRAVESESLDCGLPGRRKATIHSVLQHRGLSRLPCIGSWPSVTADMEAGEHELHVFGKPAPPSWAGRADASFVRLCRRRQTGLCQLTGGVPWCG